MYQKLILIGRVGNTPEAKTTNSNVKVCKFSLATSKFYRDKDGQKITETQWHNITVWRGIADFVEKYIKKGALVMVEGEIKYNKYEKDGETKYFTEIDCSSLQSMESRKENEANSGEVQKQESYYPATSQAALPEASNNKMGEIVEVDDLPF
jgi:single-strand DNA-binding protein